MNRSISNWHIHCHVVLLLGTVRYAEKNTWSRVHVIHSVEKISWQSYLCNLELKQVTWRFMTEVRWQSLTSYVNITGLIILYKHLNITHVKENCDMLVSVLIINYVQLICENFSQKNIALYLVTTYNIFIYNSTIMQKIQRLHVAFTNDIMFVLITG